jgi:hypothetical protein
VPWHHRDRAALLGVARGALHSPPPFKTDVLIPPSVPSNLFDLRLTGRSSLACGAPHTAQMHAAGIAEWPYRRRFPLYGTDEDESGSSSQVPPPY